MNVTTRTTLLCGLLLAMLAAWNARAVVGFDLVPMDDDINIYFNPHLGPPGEASLKWMLTDVSYMRRYVPLGWLGFSAVYGVSGLSPVGYHTANLAAHEVNTVLLFAVLLAMLRRWSREASDGWAVAGATLGTALWALHPFRAETVGWASGLLYGVAGTAALGAVLAFLKMQACAVGSRARVGWLALTGVAYLASVLAYPVALGLVGIFALMAAAEQWHGPKTAAPPTRGRLIGETLILALPGVIVLGVTVLASFGARSFWVKPATLAEFGWLPRAAQAAYAWGHYTWDRWWPVNLTPAPTRLLEVNPADTIFWVSALLLAGVTGALVSRPAWRRGALLFWLGFVGLLIPLLGFTERPYFACDRYDYFAGMVVSAALGFGLLRLASRWRLLAAGVALVVIGLLAWGQQRQLGVWANVDTLKRRMIDASDSRAFHVMQYGGWARYYAQRGDRARAEALMAEGEHVCGRGPWLAEWRAEVEGGATAAALHVRLGIDFSRAGRMREAQEHFRAALHLDPGFAAAAINYATVCALAGESREALHWYLHAVAVARDGVPPPTRQRLLTLIADRLFADGHAKLAACAVERALPEAASPEETAALQAQIARYRRAAP